MQARRGKKKSPTKSQLYNSLLDLVPLHLKAPKTKEKLSYCTDGYDCMPSDSWLQLTPYIC